MEVLVFVGVIMLVVIALSIKARVDAATAEKNYYARLIRDYGKKKDFSGAPERYFFLGRFFERHKKKFSVDDITWNDLGMDKVFQRLNYTHSACGEEYLYYRLRCPKMESKEDCFSANEEALIDYLMEHDTERANLQMAYHKIGYTGKYSLYQYLDFLDNLGERNNKAHFAAFAFYALFIASSFFVPAVGIFGIIGVMIVQIFRYLKENSENEPYLVSFAFILRFLLGADSVAKTECGEAKEICGQIQEKRKKLSGISKYALFIKKSDTSQADPMSALYDYFKMISHVNLIQFNRMLAEVKKNRELLDELYERMGYMEYILAVGEYRKSLAYYCKPEFVKDQGFACEELYHPLIDQPVACSFQTNKGVLVTGSNASGKSTFLKAVAINAILAQSIGTVLAKSCSTDYYRLYSSMALRDDLEQKESYYIVEIRALKRIVDANLEEGATGRVLCFVDEVLRGTNTVERIAASTQILKHFSSEKVLCFAATHDIELTHLLEKQYDNYHFEEEVSEGDIKFNYELKNGRATTRNAIKLLEIMGYRPSIIEEAEKQAKHFTESGKWGDGI